MAWERWEKSNHNPFAGGFASQGTGELHRNPFTGELTAQRRDTSYDSYRRGWENNRCNGSKDCGSGMACINGQCTKVWTRDGSNYRPDTCGDNSVTWAPCNKGNISRSASHGQCGRATPGNCEKDPDCPGQRCCRQQKDGSIRCVCGSCEQTDWKSCNPYCDSYYKTFGQIATGCFTKDQDGFGECGGNICDECQTCSIHTKQCDGDTDSLPCHCGGCEDNCDVCNTDKDSPNFGDCEYTPANCAECCTQFNYQCPQCSLNIPQANHCEPVLTGKPCITALRERLFKQCQKDCEDDPCKPTGSFTRCVPGEPDYSEYNGDYPMSLVVDGCPEGLICEVDGLTQFNGQTCWFVNTWEQGNLPPECERCDCNCHNDCPNCQLCGTDGKCYPDPECEVESYTLQYRWTGYYNTAYPEYDCRNKIDEVGMTTWQNAGASNVAPEDVSKYTITNTTGPQSVPPNYCSACTYLEGECRAPIGYCKYQHIVYDGGSPIISGPSYAIVRTCPAGGGDNVIVYDRQLEIRWVPNL